MTPEAGAISASVLERLPPTASKTLGERLHLGLRRLDLLLRHRSLELLQARDRRFSASIWFARSSAACAA